MQQVSIWMMGEYPIVFATGRVQVAWRQRDGAAPMRFLPNVQTSRIAGLLLLTLASVGARSSAPDDSRHGCFSMPEPTTSALLVDYFEDFLDDRDADSFRQKVLARYTAGTLARLVRCGNEQARRAAVLALGLVGGMECNPVLARAMSDPDPVVRSLAHNALWAVWFRADSPENNATLERVRSLISGERLEEAFRISTQLIARAPSFAEAYNQRAIALFSMGRYADSAADCRRTLERNPYHIGALSGLGRCYLEMGRPSDALATFKRAAALQPFDENLKHMIRALEGVGE